MFLKDILHNETKKRALATHTDAVQKLNCVIETGQKEWERLSDTCQRTLELIESIEDFLNSITNLPEKSDLNVEINNHEQRKFRPTEDYADAKTGNEVMKLGGGITLGVAGGYTFAKTAPPFAMWVAKTFGKASTGVPISSLWGAAQKNAVLAWLGGGALAKGGGGIVKGQALLTLAVPIGFGIAGGVIADVLIDYDDENKKTAEQAIEKANQLTMAAEQLEKFCAVISPIHSETEEFLNPVSEQFESLEPLRGCNYTDLSKDQQLQLDSLIDQTLALVERFNKVVKWMAEAEDWLLRKGVGETPPTF